MKKWTTPMAIEECFTSNVDVAVTTCYQVRCDAQAANAYEEGHPQWPRTPNHTNAKCTYSEKNVIQIDSKTHKITGMIGKYDMLGIFDQDVPCTFTNADYQPIDPGDLQVGDTVYWTHDYFYPVYHHQGKLELVDPNKKCMS